MNIGFHSLCFSLRTLRLCVFAFNLHFTQKNAPEVLQKDIRIQRKDAKTQRTRRVIKGGKDAV